MCPSISAISDRSFRGSVNYCMPMVLNIKEHEQFFKKCVQKMLTTATASVQAVNGRVFRDFFREIYSPEPNRAHIPASPQVSLIFFRLMVGF